MNILILEDEQPAGEKLLHNIEALIPAANIVWKRSVRDAISYLKIENHIDLIFSDIELLDGLVFKVFDEIQPDCPIIFCTAYNTFYEAAFRTNGIAYLLKPFTPEKFKEAWDKYCTLFADQQTTDSSVIIDQLKALIESEKKQYRTTFSIKKREGVFLLKVEDVAYFQAQGDFVLAIDAGGRKHIINDSLNGVEGELDARMFCRINRSEIIHRKRVATFQKYIKNRLMISLNVTDKTVLYTSNSRTPSFRKWID